MLTELADANGKGKGKALPDSLASLDTAGTSTSSSSLERTSLLPTSPNPSTDSPRRKRVVRHGRGPLIPDDSDHDSIRSSSSRIRRRAAGGVAGSPVSLASVACTLLGILFFVLLLAVAVVHLWLGHLVSEQAKSGSLEEMAERGLLFQGPSQVAMREGGDGVVIVVDGSAGIDVRRALGWENKEQAGWIRRTEARIALWGVNKVSSVGVTVGEVTLLAVEDDTELVVVPGVEQVLLPLSYPKGTTEPTLDNLHLELQLDFPQPEQLSAFLRAAWDEEKFAVKLVIRNIEVKPAGVVEGMFGKVLAKLGSIRVPEARRTIEADVPDVPGASDPSSLVHLESYRVFQSRAPHHSTKIAMTADALLVNPLCNLSLVPPTLSWGLPFHLPVSVLLPTSETNATTSLAIPLAKVVTAPFAFPGGAKSTLLSLEGELVPLGAALPSYLAKKEASEVLSRLVANYLAGKNTTVLVQYDPVPSLPSNETRFPPPIVDKLIGGVRVPLQLPGSPEGETEVFRNLKIEDMKISLSPTSFRSCIQDLLQGMAADDPEPDLFCSGKVVGELVLPGHFDSLGEAIDVRALWPDVFVYDGALPEEGKSAKLAKRMAIADQIQFSPPGGLALDSDTVTAAYPPDPIPANAFARLNPPAFIPSLTVHTPANATHNATTTISATFVDAPLFLLPGRGEVFRRFVAKLLFGGPNAKVLCGVRGVAAVRVELGGWGAVELGSLPCQGEFNVGRGGVES